MIRIMLALLLTFALVAQTGTNDDRIYDAVRQRLANDRDVKGAALEVNVKDAVVTLRGALKTEKQKEKAAKIAGKVKGVRQVVNEITVRLAP